MAESVSDIVTRELLYDNPVPQEGVMQQLDSAKLDLDVDVVEFCPQMGLQHILAVGTYKLVEEPYSRVGRLYLYSVSEALSEPRRSVLTENLTYDTTAIFDLKWAPAKEGRSEKALLAQAGTDGNVAIYSVSITAPVSDTAVSPDLKTPEKIEIESLASILCTTEGLCTSVDWSQPEQFGGQLLATSTSAREIVVLDIDAPGGPVPLLTMEQAHELEVWMVVFDRWHSDLLFSGADDCTFKGWDLRQGCDDPALDMRFSNHKAHGAGVCCIAPSPMSEYVVATGSYDGFVRLWDTRRCERPVVSEELDTGGGVWRVKWQPRHAHVLGAACMHGGFVVLTCGSGGLTVAQTHTGPDASLAYGLDWGYESLPALGLSAEPPEVSSEYPYFLVAGCSFYDQTVHLWSCDMK